MMTKEDLDRHRSFGLPQSSKLVLIFTTSLLWSFDKKPLTYFPKEDRNKLVNFPCF